MPMEAEQPPLEPVEAEAVDDDEPEVASISEAGAVAVDKEENTAPPRRNVFEETTVCHVQLL